MIKEELFLLQALGVMESWYLKSPLSPEFSSVICVRSDFLVQNVFCMLASITLVQIGLFGIYIWMWKDILQIYAKYNTELIIYTLIVIVFVIIIVHCFFFCCYPHKVIHATYYSKITAPYTLFCIKHIFLQAGDPNLFSKWGLSISSCASHIQ